MWEGQTELGDWYRTGKAIGVLIDACKRCDIGPAPQAVLVAQSCLNKAASFWGGIPIPENGSSLADWLSQWSDRFNSAESVVAGRNEHRIVQHGDGKRSEQEFSDLRTIEAIVSQIQDRPEDTRVVEQKLRDDRDQFIYEKFFGGYDASDVRELTNGRIKTEELDWDNVPRGTDVRAIAEQYAIRFAKPRLPSGKPGRPRTKTRK